MTDAMLRKDLPAAQRWAAAMQADPQATLADHLHAANIALLVDKKPFDTVFAPLAHEAAGDPAAVVTLVHWILAQNRAAEADQWLAALPPSDTQKTFAGRIRARPTSWLSSRTGTGSAPSLEQRAPGGGSPRERAAGPLRPPGRRPQRRPAASSLERGHPGGERQPLGLHGAGAPDLDLELGRGIRRPRSGRSPRLSPTRPGWTRSCSPSTAAARTRPTCARSWRPSARPTPAWRAISTIGP